MNINDMQIRPPSRFFSLASSRTLTEIRTLSGNGLKLTPKATITWTKQNSPKTANDLAIYFRILAGDMDGIWTQLSTHESSAMLTKLSS